MTNTKTPSRTRWVPNYARGGLTIPTLPPASVLPSKAAKARAEVVRFFDIFQEQNTLANELFGTVDRVKREYRRDLEDAMRAGEDADAVEDPVPSLLATIEAARAKADAARPIVADKLTDFAEALVAVKDDEVAKAEAAADDSRAVLVVAVKAAEEAAKAHEVAEAAVRFWHGVDGQHPSWRNTVGLTSKTLAKVRRDIEAE